jgi:hypothetical protein
VQCALHAPVAQARQRNGCYTRCHVARGQRTGDSPSPSRGSHAPRVYQSLVLHRSFICPALRLSFTCRGRP